jgi:hypothetical protein
MLFRNPYLGGQTVKKSKEVSIHEELRWGCYYKEVGRGFPGLWQNSTHHHGRHTIGVS